MLLIYLPIITPRSEYLIELIFKHEFNINYQLTSNLQEFKDYPNEKINYSESRINNEFFIKADALLSENFIKKIDIHIGTINETKVLFFNNGLCDMGFDIFSATFYMISRYEEYLQFIPDAYGRFKATDSLSYKNNFLQIPIVDKWIDRLKFSLQKKYPSLKILSTKFTPIITYDIDVAYKFKGRNFARNVGATFKDIIKPDLKNIQGRFQTLLNKKKDPWDVYDYLSQTINQNNFDSIFFFLVGNASAHDRNLSHKNLVLRNLINIIKSFSDVGIHPSFLTSVQTEKIAEEKGRLEKIANKKITKSRQHYLKFLLPQTYNALFTEGISEDYSMGFPEMAGFRAGTSKPFYFYDLKNEKQTSLKIFSVTFMEGAFMNSGKSKEAILEDVHNLIEEVKKVNGTFISIWHNHTVSETKEFNDWRIIHDKMIIKLSSLINK